MKINLQIIIVVFLIAWSFMLCGQDKEFKTVANIDKLKSKLETHSNNTNTIESDFIQKKHLWMLNEVLISEGKFLFKKQNNVKWQYVTPIEYTIIIHNGIFTIINNHKVKEFNINSNPLFHEINKMIVTAIRGDFIDNPDFSAEFFENQANYLAKLVPTNINVSSILENIEIYFNKQNMQVVKVVFHEPGDDFTSITFLNKKINSELSDDRFLSDTK
ncbi:MAG TPA: outer membrane lipoprotein carrier protein LolA [Bacteroidales bacterium]|nr:outer membrane lipoprotein carrier protein LolA [SAR202 cluster bacterium]HJN05868.1 outer membrane lipoprotein carrier protein LolA [Bacteroidales bacterium]|tara:strand:+ start:1234 stop:1884 length:651 start_codon:yes stop_codon:yes gene_type:complete